MNVHASAFVPGGQAQAGQQWAWHSRPGSHQAGQQWAHPGSQQAAQQWAHPGSHQAGQQWARPGNHQAAQQWAHPGSQQAGQQQWARPGSHWDAAPQQQRQPQQASPVVVTEAEILTPDIIDTEEELLAALEEIRQHRCIAVDCEGADLSKGSWREGDLVKDSKVPLHGQICVMQLGIPGKAYAIDILALGTRAFELGLRGVLESETILKVVHDFRQDQDALWHQFLLEPRHVFDCQLCDVILRRLQGFGTRYVQGSAKLFSAHGIELATVPGYGALTQEQKLHIHARFSEDRHLWARRPLPPEMVQYAKADVLPLTQLYEKQLWTLAQLAGSAASAERIVTIGSAAYGNYFRNQADCRCRLCCAAEENARFDGCVVWQQMGLHPQLEPWLLQSVWRTEDDTPLSPPGPSKFYVNEHDESVPIVPA